jgi:GMP synthase (glutamine-hydrolysing)
MGKLLGVPASFVSRHPFPGPGLAVRILGDVTQGNALETIRLVRLYKVVYPSFTVYSTDL